MKHFWRTLLVCLCNYSKWQRLEEMEVKTIPIEEGEKQFDIVDKGDVVMLPAFGAAVEEMLALSERSVQIVDTTCPWVSKAGSYGKKKQEK
ncbi:hypothetical protein MLD38_032084 [Melastoma candidum]|uniref:Uncharacterized protein n=1 Tax=Melastoma candidum TaxID=119954 RepID=A0ACB9M4Z9_9MYRT|nr:hypothetical protein MLD38_032084 [Melastoma candidum]